MRVVRAPRVRDGGGRLGNRGDGARGQPDVVASFAREGYRTQRACGGTGTSNASKERKGAATANALALPLLFLTPTIMVAVSRGDE